MFFDKYKAKYFALKTYLDNDRVFMGEATKHGFTSTQFAKTILGQLMLLYFLKIKVRKLFERRGDQNFFNHCLAPLLYEASNRLHHSVPFLKGDWFKPLEGHDWKHSPLQIDDDLFSNRAVKGERDADGILDVFDRYQFTLNEDEPHAREVTVTPEMLGYIFENLLDHEDRKSKGAFYTPREIVQYMCQESLVHYLIGKTEVPYDDMKSFIHNGEWMKEEDCSKGAAPSDGVRKIPQTVYDNLMAIDMALETIKVADPAVGAGAFPLGMLREIVNVRHNITSYYASMLEKPQDKARMFAQRSRYQLKWATIQNSIFAVDMEASAVDITKLRLWLSLIADEEVAPCPLPCLDHHIVCGNSLMEAFEGMKPFDVVIGNPPYLKERDNKHVFHPVNTTEFGKRYHQGKMDYWYYFLHKAIDITHERSLICFITPKYWINSAGATKLITRIKNELDFKLILDIGDIKAFERVVGHHMVALYGKHKDAKAFAYKKLKNNLEGLWTDHRSENVEVRYLNNVEVFTKTNQICLSDKTFGQAFHARAMVQLGDVCDVSQGVVEASDRVSKKAAAAYPRPDVAVGEGVFVLSQKKVEALCLNEKEKNCLKKYLDGKDVERYHVSFDHTYLIYSDKQVRGNIENDDAYLGLKRHLEKMKHYITSSNAPYGIHRPRKPDYFEREKLITPSMFKKPKFAYDGGNHYVGMSFSVILQKDSGYALKYLLGLLNSNFAQDWFYKNGKHRGIGVDIGVDKLREFPVPIGNGADQEEISALVEKVLLSKRQDPMADTTALEAQINKLVYTLYGLTDEEIKIVEEDM